MLGDFKAGDNVISLRVRHHELSAIGKVRFVKKGTVKIEVLMQEGVLGGSESLLAVKYGSIIKLRPWVLEFGFKFNLVQLNLIRELLGP